MSIRHIQWSGHSSLGNLELDFTDDDGQPYRTIVIAGENGTGKTSILEAISQTAVDPFPDFHDLSCLEFEDYETERRIRLQRRDEAKKDVVAVFMNNDGEPIDGENNNGVQTDYLIAQGSLLRFQRQGIAYSRARSGFKTGTIESITTGDRDWSRARIDASDDYTPVKQMLVNLRTQDDRDFTQIAMQQGVARWNDYYPRSRTCRFANAFNGFFDDLAFDRVDQVDGSHQVVFKKHSREIPIDALSTGEKQIVYRGAYLLDGLEKDEGGVVLVDEPELSMHPKWQQRVLPFYRGLFPLDRHNPVQLIIATHSEYVLETALRDSENTLVIALDDQCGKITSQRITAPYALNSLSSSEVKYRVFGVASIDYHVALFGLLQSYAPGDKVKHCDSFITQQPEYDRICHARMSRYGATEYESLPTYIRNAIDHPSPEKEYNNEDLITSIELMQAIALRLKASK